jgi:Spy/CpxP family protein refolding chaperone
MKTSFFGLILAGAALLVVPLQAVVADDDGTTGQASSSGSTNSGETQAQRIERLKQALTELGLTDAQMEQIKQIRASVTDRKERRQEILSVLTPDQKAKLRELIQERKNGAQSGTGLALAPDDSP